jgi:hypothetical protein
MSSDGGDCYIRPEFLGRRSPADAGRTLRDIADKGYHSRSVLKDLDGGEWKNRISDACTAKVYLRAPSAAGRRENAPRLTEMPFRSSFGRTAR